jgi:hypothetical protein
MLESLEDRWLPSQIGLTVSSLADSGSGTLRAAIATADAGSHSDKFTIDFSVSGTIDLQSPLPDLNGNIAVQGPGAAGLTIEPLGGLSFTSAIVTVDAGQTVSLSGLTIANGNAGGIANDGGTLTVSGCTISGNSSTSGGGGIASINGTLTVTGSTLSNNAAGSGGAIFAYNSFTDTGNFTGALTVTGSTLSNNSAEVGGAIWDYGTQKLTSAAAICVATRPPGPARSGP